MKGRPETAELVRPEDVPAPLRAWADGLIGSDYGRTIIAGWGWDGASPGVLLMLAPKGRVYQDAPPDVWAAVQKEAP